MSMIIVVGGGMAGMGAARLLAGQGAKVTLLEAGRRLAFRTSLCQGPDGLWLDNFFQAVHPDHTEVLDLLRGLGCSGALRMAGGSAAVAHQESTAPSPRLDVLMPGPRLGAFSRSRRRLLALGRRHEERLDRIAAVEWLRETVGDAATERWWRPLIATRFGNAWGSVPALWIQHFASRMLPRAEALRGALLGGLGPVIDAWKEDLERLDVRICTGFPVHRVGCDGDGVEVAGPEGRFRGHRVVLAVPVTRAQRMLASGGVRSWLHRVRYDHQGLICGLFLLDRPLGGPFWTAVADCRSPFQAIVDMSVLRPPQDLLGRHLVYVTGYVHRRTAMFQRRDSEILRDCRRALLGLYPDLEPTAFRFQRLFKLPEAEPLYTPGFLERRPPFELVPSRVYLLDASQAYPRENSWNTTLSLARRAAEWVLARERYEATGPRDRSAVLSFDRSRRPRSSGHPSGRRRRGSR